MRTEEMTIKLMFDTESKRLIFAEASKDFVDFLIFILSLPIGKVTRLLTSESMVGSIGNIYKSVANLDETYMRRNVDKDKILYPMSFSSPPNIPLRTRDGSSVDISLHFYTCSNPECESGITNIFPKQCPDCDGTMTECIEFIGKDSQGYVKSAASYMIGDDLSIASLSTASIVSMMNKFNVTKLEERKVKIGNEEALEMLKASLQSATVLTDVFLKTKKRKNIGNGWEKMEIDIISLTGRIITIEVDRSDSIYYVKTKIEYIQGIPPKENVLIFDGKELRNGQTVADCKLVNKSKIHSILSQTGC